MFTPPINAALLGGALIILQALLMLSAGGYRGRNRKAIGVEGDAKLERLVRRHGNLAENAAIFVAVLALYELIAGSTAFAFWIAIIFLIARLAHVIGFSNAAGSHLEGADGAGRIYVLCRMIGAGFTALSSIALGIATLISASAAFGA
ncbi:MAG: MAPEG family protein [Pseudomonadota bacterium]